MMKDLNVALPEQTYEILRAEAQRAQLSETALAGRVLEEALQRQILRPSTPVIPPDAILLSELMALLGLETNESACLFGVPASAIEQWRQRGLPAGYQSKLAVLAAIAELLRRNVRAGTIPGVVRTLAAAYGDRSMLDMIAAGEEDVLLADIRNSFDWAATA
jgi:hypothetical protein